MVNSGRRFLDKKRTSHVFKTINVFSPERPVSLLIYFKNLARLISWRQPGFPLLKISVQDDRLSDHSKSAEKGNLINR